MKLAKSAIKGLSTVAKTTKKPRAAATKNAGATPGTRTRATKADKSAGASGEDENELTADGAEGGEVADSDDGEGDGEAIQAEVVDSVPLDDDEEDLEEEVVDDDDDVAAGDESRPARAARGAAADPGMSIERSDPMTAYMREVQRHRVLSPEEVHELAVKFLENQDPKIAARLVTSNLRLVVKIAYEYRRAYKNMMDLVQEGNIGLMQAVKRYDPYRGVRLSSYSAFWIRAYILRFILNNWRLVKLGTTQAQRKLFFNLKKKRAELEAMGISPTDAEIAKQLDVPESDVREMSIRLDSSEKSLDTPVGDADGRSVTRGDMIAEAGAGPEVLMAEGEMQSMLRANLAEFRKTLLGKEKELAIFDERLVADDPLTLQELGDRFSISRERVRQLEQRVMTRLRDFLQETMGEAAHVQER